MLVVQVRYYEISPSKNYFSYKSRYARKRRIFFSDELHTRSRKWKPLSSAKAGLSPQEGDVRKKRRRPRKGGLSPQEGDVRKKEKKKIKVGEKVAPRRKGSVCPQPRKFFFWFTSIWVLRDPSRLNIGSYET